MMAAPGVVAAWERGVVAVGALLPAGGQHLLGSGFLIDAGAGLLTTCAHVLQDVNLATGVPQPAYAFVGMNVVAIGIGSPVQWMWRAEVLRVNQPPAPRHPDNGLDLAVLRLSANLDGSPLGMILDLAGQPMLALPLADEGQVPPNGTHVWVLGYGQSDDKRTTGTKVTRGVLAGTYNDANGAWLCSNADVLAGHSGGPAVADEGVVIGWCVRSQYDRTIQGGGHQHHPWRSGDVPWAASGINISISFFTIHPAFWRNLLRWCVWEQGRTIILKGIWGFEVSLN